jgi:hypothetical protein
MNKCLENANYDQMCNASLKGDKYFFSRKAMNFFLSKIETGTDSLGLFITSEQFEYKGIYKSRNYTVRFINTDGKISGASKFNQFTTLDKAKNYIATIHKAINTVIDNWRTDGYTRYAITNIDTISGNGEYLMINGDTDYSLEIGDYCEIKIDLSDSCVPYWTSFKHN